MLLKRISGPITFCLVVIMSIAVMSSCDKNDDDDNVFVEPEETGYAADQLLLEHIYNNVDRVIERAMVSGKSGLKGGENPLAACAEVIIDSSGTSNLMIIDFGTQPCLGFDGRYRTGRILIEYDKLLEFKEKGSYRYITFSSYEIDGYKVYGTKRIINLGADQNGDYYYQVKRVDSVYVSDDDGYIRGTSDRRMTWYKGFSTPQTSDDAYRLSGSGVFYRYDDSKYTTEIARPLVVALNCNWITEGIINIYPDGATQRVLDYGEGGCEDDATISVNGVVTDVRVP